MKSPLSAWIVCAALALPACFGEKDSAVTTDAALTAAGAPAAEAGCTDEHADGASCASEAAGAGCGGCDKAGAEGGCAMKTGAPAAPAAADEHEHAEGEAGCSANEVCSSQVLAMAKQADVVVTEASAAAPPPAPADATAYGAELTLDTVTPISALMADWDSYEGKTVQVRGTVVGVCAHRGCWMDIAGTEDFQKIRFKVNDGDMVFPITDKGRVATAEGVVQKLVIPIEQLRTAYAAQAEAAGESFDPASVTEPKIVWQLKGTGARIG